MVAMLDPIYPSPFRLVISINIIDIFYALKKNFFEPSLKCGGNIKLTTNFNSDTFRGLIGPIVASTYHIGRPWSG